MPFASGKIDPSEAGKKGAEARWRAPDGSEAVSEGPVDVLAEMEALLSRPKSQDRTGFQRRLRKQYEEDFDAYMDRLVRLKGKAGKGEGPADVPEERDEGTENALAVLDRVLKEIREGMDASERIGAEVAHAWGKMTPEARQAVLDAAGIPHAVATPGVRAGG